MRQLAASILIFAIFLITRSVLAVNLPISSLPELPAPSASPSDSLVDWNSTTGQANKTFLYDLINLPPFQTEFSLLAPLASPTFTGTVTSPSFVGPLTGNADTATALSASPSPCPSGEVAQGITSTGDATGCTVPGGSPGGSSGQVQYNSSGSFAGDSGFTYDGSGNVTATKFIGPLNGNADTATTAAALTSTPTQCSAGQVSNGIAANGDANCITASGGGSSIIWSEVNNSPIPVFENGLLVYAFSSGQTQTLNTSIRIPTTYTSGNKVQLKLPFYDPDSSGTALLTTVATLIRTGTDTIISTSNQRTSTNTAVTLGSGTVSIPQSIAFDLTDSSGKINSVSVSPGDTILVSLTRGSDTGTSDIKAMIYAAEVTFQ